MKSILVLFFLLGSGKLQAQRSNPNYDSALAKKLDANDYGMKKFVFVVLKTGANQTTDKKFIDSCFAGHMDNMGKMVKAGQLIVAGPFGKNEQQFRGLFILNIPTLEEARTLLQTDPAIHANLLMADVFEWYGSAALPEYLDASDKVWKKRP